MVTPPSAPRSAAEEVGGSVSQKRKASKELEVRQSASPVLENKKKPPTKKMQRTPQASMTQSKLTGFGIVHSRGGPSSAMEGPPTTVEANMPPLPPPSAEDDVMEVSVPEKGPAASREHQPITADFLLKALRENKEDIVKSFNANINALAVRVEANVAGVAANATSIAGNKEAISTNEKKLDELTSRVRALERKDRPSPLPMATRALLSDEYVDARRSVRLWPIKAPSEEDLWGGVGDFLHTTLGIREDHMGQDDIESITRVVGQPLPGGVSDEVVVMFFDKKKRDDVFANAPNLANLVDGDGRPLAGIRLEIPPELTDTFRLLSRFGTRLRARHGQGTKRHIKFDDYTGSLYTNVKLPGDENWTKVTPDMAHEDLERSMREENALHQKRLASKLLPGPRDRLSRPLPVPAATAGPSSGRVVAGPPDGRRPRWSIPDKSRSHPYPR